MVQVHSFLMIKTMTIFLKGMISLLNRGTKGAMFIVWTQGSERASLFATFFDDMKQIGGCEVFSFGVRNKLTSCGVAGCNSSDIGLYWKCKWKYFTYRLMYIWRDAFLMVDIILYLLYFALFAVAILVIIFFVLHFHELLNSKLETNSFLLAIFSLLSLNNRHKHRSYSTLNSVVSEHISKTLKQSSEEELACRIIDNSNSQFIILPEGKQIVLSSDFIEWLRGFTDAEGCFLVVKTGNTFAFRFLIKLHVDDASVLDFIQKTLGIGRVTIYQSSAIFSITSQK